MSSAMEDNMMDAESPSSARPAEAAVIPDVLLGSSIIADSEERKSLADTPESIASSGPMDAVLGEPPTEAAVEAEERMAGQVQEDSDEDQRGEDRATEAAKRVKVYELTGQEWQERGTGFIDGTYDNQFDEAHLVVWWEADPDTATPDAPSAGEGGAAISAAESSAEAPKAKDKSDTETEPGGFLVEGNGTEEGKELLRTRVLYNVPYQRQQDTLIVWTEPDGTDKALSFQDPVGCNNIWEFIQEVQQHMMLLNQVEVQGRSSPLMSPPNMQDPGLINSERDQRNVPTLSLVNLREQDSWIKSQAMSPAGREKLVEALLSVDWLRQMVRTFEEAEDLESLEDLHCLCSMLQSILALNDNSVYETFVQDSLFLDLCGILEYDPEYPHYKAGYRDFLQKDRFKQVIQFDDPHILAKIHHTYRLQYLKDVILARTLDDPTFNIINSLLFFNQIDIINHVQNNDGFMRKMFERFQPARVGRAGKAPEQPADSAIELAGKRDVVKLLHSLVNMGKQIQLPNRSALYKKLLDRGLLVVIGWAFKQEQSDEIPARECLGKAVEMFGQILEHDVNAIKSHVNMEKEREKETGQQSLLQGMISLLVNHNDVGVKSQMSDGIRILLDIPEGFEAAARGQKDAPIAEAFAAYFFDTCAKDMYKPLILIPDFTKARKDRHVLNFTHQQFILLQHLCDLLACFIAQHGHRSQFFILSQNLSVQVASVLYTKYKPLRHAALKYFKACIKTNNHFINRHLAKNDLMLPIMDVLEFESARDNMLTAVCLEVLEILRTSTIKTIINYMFGKHQAKLALLESRPSIQHYIKGLRLRWEQINEPPPQDAPRGEGDDGLGWSNVARDDDDYFNMSDDETDDDALGPPAPVQPKLKRKASSDPTISGKRLAVDAGNSREPIVRRLLGLDYGDDSDSDNDTRSPKQRTSPSLAPSPMELDEPGPSTPRIRLRLTSKEKDKGKEPSSLENLGDYAAKIMQKRKRAEEEEEEGAFGSLMGKSSARPGTPRATSREKDHEPVDAKGGAASSKSGSLLKDAGRQIKLKMGGIGRKLGGGAGEGSRRDEKDK